MKSDLIAIIDVLLGNPDTPPDLAAIESVAATSTKPIALLAEVVRLLWLAAEMPQEFDKAILELVG